MGCDIDLPGCDLPLALLIKLGYISWWFQISPVSCAYGKFGDSGDRAYVACDVALREGYDTPELIQDAYVRVIDHIQGRKSAGPA